MAASYFRDRQARDKQLLDAVELNVLKLGAVLDLALHRTSGHATAERTVQSRRVHISVLHEISVLTEIVVAHQLDQLLLGVRYGLEVFRVENLQFNLALGSLIQAWNYSRCVQSIIARIDALLLQRVLIVLVDLEVGAHPIVEE